MIAYFIRGEGESWAVVKLLPDNREEVVQGDLTLIDAEILAAMLLEDMRTPVAPTTREADTEDAAPQARHPRQLSLKF
jgi:hypothetical protein